MKSYKKEKNLSLDFPFRSQYPLHHGSRKKKQKPFIFLLFPLLLGGGGKGGPPCSAFTSPAEEKRICLGKKKTNRVTGCCIKEKG